MTDELNAALLGMAMEVAIYCILYMYVYVYAISTFHLSGCSPADFHAPGRGPFFDGFT